MADSRFPESEEAAANRLRRINEELDAIADPQRSAEMRAWGADLDRATRALGEARSRILDLFPALRTAMSAPTAAPVPPPVAAVPAFLTGPPVAQAISAAASLAAAPAVAAAAARQAQRQLPPPSALGSQSPIQAGGGRAGWPGWPGWPGGGLFAAAALSGGATSLASAADPFSTMPTFQASLKGVAIEAGSAAIPAFESMSARLQDLERVLERMDPRLKESIGQWVVWGTVGTAAAVATVRVGQAVAGTAVAIGRLGAAMVMTPWGLVALGVAATAALATAWLNVGDNAERASRAMGLAGAGGRGGRSADGADEKARRDFDQLPPSVRRRLTAAQGDEGKISKILDEEKAQAREELEKARSSQVAALAGRGGAAKKFEELAAAALPGLVEKFEAGLPALNARNLPRGEYEFAEMRMALRESREAASAIVGKMRDAGANVSITQVEQNLARRAVRQSLGQERYEEIVGFAEGKRVLSNVGWLDRLFNSARDRTGFSAPVTPAFQPLATDASAAARVKAAEERVRIAEGARSGGPVRDFQGPAPSIYSDPGQLADKVQLAALAVGDKSQMNQQKQLEQSIKSGELLQMIHGELNRLNQNVQPRHR